MESDPHVLVCVAAAVIEGIVHVENSPTAHRIIEGRGLSHHTIPATATLAAATAVSTESTSRAINRIPDNYDAGQHTPPVFVTLAVEETGMAVPEPTFPTVYTIIDDHDLNCNVLDAIASISVSNTYSQVVVALEMDVSKKVAVLTVANSSGVGPDLIAYLNGLWRLMSIMSVRCEKYRLEVDLTARVRPQLPIAISEVVDPWRTEFIKRVYCYCRSENIVLFNRGWNTVKSFIGLFKKGWNDLPGDRSIKRQFKDVVYSFKAMHSFYSKIHSSISMTDEEWRDLICLMEGTVLDIDSILDDPMLCEKLAIELQYPHISPHHLRRTLGELIAQHRQIQILLLFSNSPRSHPALLCKLTVRAIPHHLSIPISLPTTPLCWQSLIESVCGDNLIASYSWLDQQVTKLSTHSSEYGSNCSGIAHGVCAMIASLEASPRNSQPPFNYIGASTLICNGCHAWIQSFNAVGGRQYRTRGPDGSWRFPWIMPEIASATESQKATIRAHLASLVAAECVQFWTKQGQLYPASDTRNTISKSLISTTADAARRRRELVTREMRGRPYEW